MKAHLRELPWHGSEVAAVKDATQLGATTRVAPKANGTVVTMEDYREPQRGDNVARGTKLHGVSS